MKLRVPALGQAQDLAQVKMIPITKAQEDASGSGSGNGMVALNIMADQSNATKVGSDFFLEGDKNKPDNKRKT